VIEAKGVDRTVTFDGATIVIRYQRAARLRRKIARASIDDVVIPISDLATVEHQPSTLLWNGFVRFACTGEDAPEPPPNISVAATVKFASRDPKAVVFGRYQDKDFAALYEAVTEALNEAGR
jgi:Domain of unknown function (DUF4429)